ncbi:MAG: hypothetical protein LBQ54_06030 [Planctomycetaceae bacterium]|nr:hypothetical protein [Planctomycetaceae bacterium]
MSTGCLRRAASRGGRMELPLRSNDPLTLLAGIREWNNVITGSRTRSREASAVQRATLPVRRQLENLSNESLGT